jgi:hypothetical protein
LAVDNGDAARLRVLRGRSATVVPFAFNPSPASPAAMRLSLTLARGILPLLAVAATLLAGDRARAQAEPHYWRQRIFFVPYQPNLQDPRAGKAEKIQLLVRDQAGQWAVLQEAEPQVRGFSYHAANDGEYAFALRLVDRRGEFWPEVITQPLLRIQVDTQPPSLQLVASLDSTGQVVIRYEARDLKLKPETLRLEAQAEGGAWERVALGPPEVSRTDQLTGQAAWRPPVVGRSTRFRASIDDAAGNSQTAAADGSLIGPVLDPSAGPQLAPPGIGLGGAESQASRPFNSAASTPLEWPSNDTLASSGPPSPNASVVGGASDPFAAPRNDAAGRTSAQFAADVAAPSLLGPDAGNNAAAAPVAGNEAWSTRAASVPTVSGTGASAGASAAGPEAMPWVNSTTFDVDYDIQTVGPWGVSKVELWGTRDGGREWISLGVDNDNRSPMRVNVPGEGVYGFRIVVDGGNGAAAPPPRAGDQPELSVGVDLAGPRAALSGAEVGRGPLVGHLVIRWEAADDRLAARPTGLFYSATAEGPWMTIATDLDNSGEYAWRLGREAPPRVFLRLEVRDIAGNVAVQQTEAAVELNLPLPTGRLRNVRPVQAEPGRYRTAAGARQPDR